MTVPSGPVTVGPSPGGISLPVRGWVSELGRRRDFNERFSGPVSAAAAASPSSLEAARLLSQPWSIRVRSAVTSSSGVPSRASAALTSSGSVRVPGGPTSRSTRARVRPTKAILAPLGSRRAACATRVM